jgi:hypothetical protein
MFLILHSPSNIGFYLMINARLGLPPVVGQPMLRCCAGSWWRSRWVGGRAAWHDDEVIAGRQMWRKGGEREPN